MPEENIDIVRRVYESWARGDFSQGEVFHPEIVFEMVDWPHQCRSHVDCGPNVLVLNRIEARGKESGADVSAGTASVWTFPSSPRDGGGG